MQLAAVHSIEMLAQFARAGSSLVRGFSLSIVAVLSTVVLSRHVTPTRARRVMLDHSPSLHNRNAKRSSGTTEPDIS